MTIKQLGGVFGRNPTFNDVTIEGQLTFDGDIDINSDLKIDGDLDVTGGMTIDTDTLVVTSANNRVGVGTGAPVTDLDVRNNISMGDGTSVTNLSMTRNSANYITASNASGYLAFRTGGSNECLRLDGSGNAKIINGNLIIGTSGKGIDFSATSGTGTSELLDDYEEGTWTPVYSSSAGSFATMTMEVYDAVYTKIGNTVFISAFMRTDDVSVGTASGNLYITGLPFTPSAVISVGGIEVSYATAFAGDAPLSGWIAPSYIQPSYRTSVNGSSLPSLVADLTAGTTANQNTLRISGMYKTAS